MSESNKAQDPENFLSSPIEIYGRSALAGLATFCLGEYFMLIDKKKS